MTIGADIPRLDGLAKLAGATRYVDDLAPPGLLHGGAVRSPVARGRIRRIRFDPAIDWSDFTVVDHRDIPGPNQVKLIECDQPALAAREVRHKYEPIVLLAHRSPRRLREALRAVRVEIDPLPPVRDPRQPLTPELVQYGADNLFKRIDIRKGAAQVDADSTPAPPTDKSPTPAAFEQVFTAAPHVIEGQYVTGAQEHLYLENQGMLAQHENGRLVVRGSMQCPFYVVDALAHLFARPRDQLCVIQTPVGGGFGGKEDYPSIIAIHAALLAEKARRPVKIVYDRQEDMQATTKRHPSRVRHRTAVDRDGRLLAMQIDVLLDGGAYMTLSPVVLSRAAIHAAGPYACEHIHIHGEVRLTNSPPYGAFRGFGAPQTLFAVERHIDEIARHLRLDPAELRRRNLLREGQTTATGQVRRDTVDHAAQLDQALRLIDYEQRQRAHDQFNRAHPYLRRGVGMATFYHGAGFTGAGEAHLASEAQVEGLPDGAIEVQTAQTDMGQGTTTIMAQIAAAALGVDESAVRVATPDTSRVPNSGPTVASRTAMVVGRLVQQACDDLVQQARDDRVQQARDDRVQQARDDRVQQARDDRGQQTAGAESGANAAAPKRGKGKPPHADAPRAVSSPSVASSLRRSVASITHAIRDWHDRHPGQRLLGRARYVPPPQIEWDEENYRGDAYATFAWASYAAEVEIDLRTYMTRVLDFVAVQEVGRVLNPTLARGQIAGGVAQAIGWALLEQVLLEGGAMRNSQMTNYIIPTAGDLPPIRVYFQEQPSAFGPGGAKGIGELPMDGPAPAVVNAVCRALDIRVTEIPLTPERLLHALENRCAAHSPPRAGKEKSDRSPERSPDGSPDRKSDRSPDRKSDR